MNYQESVDWLFDQFPAYQKIGVSAYKPDLNNVLELCTYFKVEYSSLKFIHIAGTNGKGSTSNYLASILQEASYKTGLFTSPHILDFRERIRVNGEMISEEKVISFCEEIKNSNFDIKPSFFEITWVLCLIHFVESKCKICVIETGLGGRLDSTNIINPILSIITNISLDHIAILGNTLEEITFEKAGIIKNDIPVLIGECDSISRPIFIEQAKIKSSQIYFSEDFEIGNSFFDINSYLFKNERTIKNAIQLLNLHGLKIERSLINKGLKNVSRNTGFIGRYQEIARNPKIIVDAAHNIAGISELIKTIKTEKFENLHIIYGASNDKDALEILNLLPTNCNLYLCTFSNQRSLTFEQLKELNVKINQKSQIFSSVKESFNYVQNTVNENDIILITGSFFLLIYFFDFFSKKELLN
jgi:dihydrofolate synthase/folylpolyglutamate synthase